MSDAAETLKRFLKTGIATDAWTVRDALRALLEANERLEATIDKADEHTAMLMKENERLRDEVGRLVETHGEGCEEALLEVQGERDKAEGENERLRAALEGQPVIKSEWEEKCEENGRLRAENRGHLANNENLADACKQYERRAVTAEAEVERLRAIKIAYASMGEIADSMGAKIDLALAQLKRNPCDCREDDCHHCELVRLTVKALKGGK